MINSGCRIGASCCCLVTKSCSTLCYPWTVPCQAPLPMGFRRQGAPWVWLPFFSRESAHPKGSNHTSCVEGRFFTTVPLGPPESVLYPCVAWAPLTVHLLWARHCSRSQSLPQENRSYTLYRVKESNLLPACNLRRPLSYRRSTSSLSAFSRTPVWRDRPALMQLLLLGTLWAVHNLYNCTRRAPAVNTEISRQTTCCVVKSYMGGVQGQEHFARWSRLIVGITLGISRKLIPRQMNRQDSMIV